MHPDLEAIVAADEEARSRVAFAEERRDREVSAARADRDASIAARKKAASDALENELQVIRAEGDSRIETLRRQQDQYLASLAAAGELRFDDGVALFLRTVCEVAR
jgi:vacuolar-type H+-ATPase subunit H